MTRKNLINRLISDNTSEEDKRDFDLVEQGFYAMLNVFENKKLQKNEAVLVPRLLRLPNETDEEYLQRTKEGTIR
jgi:hypothetical protein